MAEGFEAGGDGVVGQVAKGEEIRCSCFLR